MWIWGIKLRFSCLQSKHFTGSAITPTCCLTFFSCLSLLMSSLISTSYHWSSFVQTFSAKESNISVWFHRFEYNLPLCRCIPCGEKWPLQHLPDWGSWPLPSFQQYPAHHEPDVEGSGCKFWNLQVRDQHPLWGQSLERGRASSYPSWQLNGFLPKEVALPINLTKTTRNRYDNWNFKSA